MSKAVKIGRPQVYTGKLRKYIAKLAKKSGAMGARALLNATPKKAREGGRDLDLVPKALNISMPTILKIAKEHGVEFQMGRRAA